MEYKERLNSFEQGMNQDIHPSLIKENEYIEAWNAVLMSSTNSSLFELSNEPGFINPVINNLPDNFIVLGLAPINDDLVIFGIAFNSGFGNNTPLNDHVIGLLIRDINGFLTFQEVVNDNNVLIWENQTVIQERRLNFDIRYQIQCVTRISYDNKRVVYWTDGLNPPRTLNLDIDYTLPENRFRNLAEQIQLFDVYQRPYIKYEGYVSGGAIKPGIYQFCARYLNKTYDPTGFGYISNPIPVVTNFRTDTRDEYIGGPYDHPVVNKIINLSIHNIDPDYDYIEVACIYYTDAGSVPQIRLIGRYPIRSSILEMQFTGDFMNETPLSIPDIIRPPVVYNTAKHILSKDGRLFLSNLTTSPLRDLQELANNITISAIFRDIPVTDDTAYFSDYKEENNTFEYKSYRRDEVYSFAIVGIFKDGSESLAHHIPGVSIGNSLPTDLPYFNNNFIYLSPIHNIVPYQSEIEYDIPPVVEQNYYNTLDVSTNTRLDLTGQPILHHRMPSNDYQPFYYQDVLGNSFIRVLGIQLIGIREFLERPENAELQRNLVQIILVRQQRNNIENKSIYSQGLTHGFLYQEGRFQNPNSRDTEFNTLYHQSIGEDSLNYYRFLGIDSLDFPEVEVGTYSELKEYLIENEPNSLSTRSQNDTDNDFYVPYEQSDETGVRSLPIRHIVGLKPDFEQKNILPCLILDPFNRNTNIFFKNVIPLGGSLGTYEYYIPNQKATVPKKVEGSDDDLITRYCGFYSPELVFDKAFFIPSGTARLKTVSLVSCSPVRHINGFNAEYTLFHNGSFLLKKEAPYNETMRAPYHHLIFDFTQQTQSNVDFIFNNTHPNYTLYKDIIRNQKTLWNDIITNNAGILGLRNKVINPFLTLNLNPEDRGGEFIKINNYESESYFLLELNQDPIFLPQNINTLSKYIILIGGIGVLYYIPILPSLGRELLTNAVDIFSGDQIGGIVGSINSIAAHRAIRGFDKFRGVFTGRYKVTSGKRFLIDQALDIITFSKSLNMLPPATNEEIFRYDRVASTLGFYEGLDLYSPPEFQKELYGDNDFYLAPLGLPILLPNPRTPETINNIEINDTLRSILHFRHFFDNITIRNDIPEGFWLLTFEDIVPELPQENKYLYNVEIENRRQYGYLDTNEYIHVEVLFSENVIQENSRFNIVPNQFDRDEDLKSYELFNNTPFIFNGDTFITKFAYRSSCNIPCGYANLQYTEGMKNAFQKSFGLPSLAKIPLLGGGVNMFLRDLAVGAGNEQRFVITENGRVRKDILRDNNNTGLADNIKDLINDNYFQDIKLAFTEYIPLKDPINTSKEGLNLRSLNIFYCESSFNLEYRHRPLDFTSTETTSRGRGNQFNAVRDLQSVREGVPFYPYNTLDDVFLVTPEFNHSDGYNFQYSFENSIKKYYGRKFGQVFVNEFPTRTIYSEPIDSTTLYGKLDKSELSDKWKQFLPLNYQDITKLKGEITNLFEHNKFLYIHTEKSLFRVFVNNNTMIQDTDGFGLFMGNKSVFSQEPEEIFSLSGGYVGCIHKYTGINTPYGYIFWDENSKKLFQFTEQLEEISRNGMYKWFLETPDIYRIPPPIGWNDPNSDLYNPNYFNNPANPNARGITAFYDPIHYRYVIGFKYGQTDIDNVLIDWEELPLPNPNYVDLIDPGGNFTLLGIAEDRNPDPNVQSQITTPFRFFNVENLTPGETNCFNLNVTDNPNGECFLINTPGTYTLNLNIQHLASVCYQWLNTECVTVFGAVGLIITIPNGDTGLVEQIQLDNYVFQLEQEPVDCQMPPGIDWICVPPFTPPVLPWNTTPIIDNEFEFTVTQAMINSGDNRICLQSAAILTANLTCTTCSQGDTATFTYDGIETVETSSGSAVDPDPIVPFEPDSDEETQVLPPDTVLNQPFTNVVGNCITITTPGLYTINVQDLIPQVTYTLNKACVQVASASYSSQVFLRLPGQTPFVVAQDFRRIRSTECGQNFIVQQATFTPYNNTFTIEITANMIATNQNRICIEVVVTTRTETGFGLCLQPPCPDETVPRAVQAFTTTTFTGNVDITPIIERYVRVRAEDFLRGTMTVCTPVIQVPIFETVLQNNNYYTISHNLLNKKFTSFHSYFPAISTTNNKEVYSSPNLLIEDYVVYLHNIRNYEVDRPLSGRYGVFYNQIGQPDLFIIKAVCNMDPIISKTFGNMFINAQIIDESIVEGIIQYRDFFQTLECWTDSQSTGFTPITIYPFDGDEILTNCKLYNHQYQLKLPLVSNVIPGNTITDNQIERLQPINIYDPTTNNFNLENKPRLKGKYLIFELTYNNTTNEIPQNTIPPRTRNFNFILKTIITKFRYFKR